MLEDINDEKHNPLNWEIDPNMNEKSRNDAQRIKLQKSLDYYEEKTFGPEGKPVYVDSDEERFCDKARMK